mmetsp:Transcript_29967/g.96701  ORF Transcript_29967/g.96701 Transcript_29967/m.96701 type:complete len:394 (-) Transcript_29967:13-1194(-)
MAARIAVSHRSRSETESVSISSQRGAGVVERRRAPGDRRLPAGEKRAAGERRPLAAGEEPRSGSSRGEMTSWYLPGVTPVAAGGRTSTRPMLARGMAPAGSAPALNPPTSSHQRSSSGASAKKRRRQAGLTSPFLCSQPCTRPGGVVRSGLGVAGGGRMAGGGGGSGGPGGRCKAEGRAGGSLWFGEGTAPSPAPLQHAGPVEVRFKTWVVEAWAAESGPTWASAAASAACCPVATEATGTAPRLGAAAGAAARVAAAEAIGVGARAWAAGSARPPASVGAVAPAGAAPVGVAAPSTGDGCQALVGGRLLGPCDVWHIPTSPLSNGSPREAAGGRAKGEVRGAAAWDRDRTVAAGGSAGGAAGGAASGPVQASAPADAVPSGPMPNGVWSEAG